MAKKLHAAKKSASAPAKVRKPIHHEYGELLLMAEFSGALDAWTEQLRMKRHQDGRVTLSSVGREVLASGRQGRRLIPQDDDAVITLAPGEIDDALSWLSGREWDKKSGFEDAKREIVTALES
jgi:hypothetical protein